MAKRVKRLNDLGKWTEEDEEEKERGEKKRPAKLVEAIVEVQGRGDPLHWVSVSVS